MLYTPLLPGAAGGTLEPRHVVGPVREQLERTRLHIGTVPPRTSWPASRRGGARSAIARSACSSTWAATRPFASTLAVKWRGFPAWFLARTYHLALMPGNARRARLVTDCTTGLLFGRDSAELGQLGHPPALRGRSAGGTDESEPRREEVVSRAGVGLDD